MSEKNTVSPTLLAVALQRVAGTIKPAEELEEGTHPIDVTLRIYGDIVKGAPTTRKSKSVKVSDSDVLAILLDGMDETARKRAVGAAVKKIAQQKDIRAIVDVKTQLIEQYADKHGLVDEREISVSGRTTGAPLYDVIAIGGETIAA